jgi:hypothetical protein
MFAYNERDLHRMPTPARSHLPVKDFIAASEILDDENSLAPNDADVALLRLPAPSLRGTFAQAYALLAKLVSEIGWDELLKCRSLVFVMEEEYRLQKAGGTSSNPTVIPEVQGESRNGRNGTTKGKEVGEDEPEGFGPLAIDETDSEAESADEDASTRGVRVTPPPLQSSAEAPESPAIPTIKVSTESDGERERKELDAFEQAGESTSSTMAGEAPGLVKPLNVEAKEEKEEKGSSFTNKRLCERWLDNLFMVLYEVSSLYLISFSLSLLTLWFIRIFEYIPFGELRWPISKRNIYHIEKLRRNGRF